MSDALAIAGVSVLLKELLDRGMRDHNVGSIVGGDVPVSVLPPSRIATDSNEPTQLNLFLHRITRNTGGHGQDQPMFNNEGQRISNPPLVLDLHYFVTAYGKEELHAEIILGYAMQLLHEKPVLTKGFIEQVFGIGPGNQVTQIRFPPDIAKCGLEHRPGPVVTLSPTTLSAEDVLKLWSALQCPYRPTVAYIATCVLIESKLPVREIAALKQANLFVKDPTHEDPTIIVAPDPLP